MSLFPGSSHDADDEENYERLVAIPICSLPITRDEGVDRPDVRWFERYPDRVRVADLICDRSRLLGVVLYGSKVSTTEGVLEPLGNDFFADCGCDTTHAIDGDLLLRAVLDLPGRHGTCPPVIDVRHVERRALPTTGGHDAA